MNWPNGKRWAYSITYDEGCERLLDHALPVHRRHGILGHLAMVAAQIGVPRTVPGSTFDGWMILGKDQVRDLVSEGWGVSCHGMTHARIGPDTAEFEVVQARRTIEQTLDMPVTTFTVPGNMQNYPAARAVAEKAGYRAILGLEDAVNTAGTDPLRLHRTPLHDSFPPPFFSRHDPYRRLHQAIDLGGWVIDYCHCPLPGRPSHPFKDCTVEQLDQRFETVRRVGGSDVWLAEVGEVLDHLLAP